MATKSTAIGNTTASALADQERVLSEHIGGQDGATLGSNGVRLWDQDPSLAFERFRDVVCEAIQIVSLLYRQALAAPPEQNLAQAGGLEFHEALERAIVEAQGIWFQTPISRYLDRPEGRIHLSRQESGTVTGSCYHDLALAVAVGTLQSIKQGEPARDYVRLLRFRTAAGADVPQHLASLISDVRSECQKGIARWRAEHHPAREMLQSSGAAGPAQPSVQGKEAKGGRQDQTKVAGSISEVDEDDDQGPTLSGRQYDMLQALYILKAFNADSKQTTAAIAVKAEGPEAKAEEFKEPITDLKRRELVDTKEGRGGGCWLTPAGRLLIKRIRKL